MVAAMLWQARGRAGCGTVRVDSPLDPGIDPELISFSISMELTWDVRQEYLEGEYAERSHNNQNRVNK